MQVIRWRLFLFALFAALAVPVLAAHAQGLPAGGEAAPTASLASQAITWIFAQQKRFQREINVIFHQIAADGGIRASAWLITISFVYGVFHAAGPGHGKAILSAYLLSHKETTIRAVTLAAAAALCQGVMAILLIYGLIWIVGWQMRETSAAIAWSTRLGAALVVLVGFLLALRAAIGLVRRFRNHDEHEHGHHHGHADGCGCGHAHVPTASQLARARDWRTIAGLVLSIGIRPCSGAVLILAFAHAMHLARTGIVAVLVMSAGTALSIATLALLAVKARDWSAAVAGSRGRQFGMIGNIVSLAGGLLIMALGAALVMASLSRGHPLL